MKIKRFFALFLLFALILSLTAFADVAYLPIDDFIMEHEGEYRQENRYYISNSPEGYVTAYSSPTGTAKAVIPNGLEYYIYLTWTDGETLWGCTEYMPDTLGAGQYGGETAWLDMSLMAPRYDSEAFMEEHSHEIRDENTSLSIEPQHTFRGYRYPGSGIVELEFDNPGDAMLISFIKTYTDADGRSWGYIGYHYGIRNIWVCMDDPYSELPAGAEYKEPEIYPAASPDAMEEARSEEAGHESAVMILALAVAVIAAAIVAYIIIHKRRYLTSPVMGLSGFLRLWRK